MGKAALVTGGAVRIGRRIALALAEDGYDIALHYNRSEDQAIETCEQVRGMGVDCRLFSCDFLAVKEIETLIPSVVAAMPDLEVLVNSAAIFLKAPLDETTSELLDKHMTINFTAPLLLTRDFAREVGTGCVINVVDTRITSDRGTYFAYSLSKKALGELTRMAGRELGPDVRVNGICPGAVLPPPGEGEEYLTRLEKNLPTRKHPDLDELVDAVRMLVSNQAVTGQLIFVDSGEHLL